MGEALRQRREDRDRLLALAGRYVEDLSARIAVMAAAVAGSVARGDFNVWSDVDVVVVSRDLPSRTPERGTLLLAEAPPGVQPVGFLPEEFEAAWRKGNVLVREAVLRGVVILGEDYLRGVAGREGT